MTAAAVVSFLLLLAFMAFKRPGYFASPNYVKGLMLIECMIGAIYLYRRIFLPVVIVTFLLAGSNLPMGGGVWIAGRWAALGVGALIGAVIMLKERRHHFGLFHAFAGFAVISAIVSAAVSRYQSFAFLKATSLLLLFLYAGTGARLAVQGRENSFFHGLLTACEAFVGLMTFFYVIGIESMGNTNSLGAIMGVIAVPILLWGTLLDEGAFALRRRQIFFLCAMLLVFHSHSRAGLAAALFSCAVFCLALRQYKLLGQGIVIILIIVASSAIFDPEAFSRAVASLNSSVVYKGQDPSLGVFASRVTPWQASMQSIQSHFWFGSGFGTTDTGHDANAPLATYDTNENVSLENGSSYLAILSWVGVAGVVPFALLLFALLWSVLRTVSWMLTTRNPSHPAIPLAMIVLAGFVNAGFEDWLFAVGYYLTIIFWCLAFILVDITPYARLPRFSYKWRPGPVHGLSPGAVQGR